MIKNPQLKKDVDAIMRLGYDAVLFIKLGIFLNQIDELESDQITELKKSINVVASMISSLENTNL